MCDRNSLQPPPGRRAAGVPGPSQSLTECLGQDLVARCLAFVPVREQWRARATCRKWNEMVDSDYFYQERKRLANMEQWVCAAGGAATGVNGFVDGTTLLGCCEVYDPADGPDGRWHALSEMPTKRYGFACVGMGGKLYACGGWSEERNIVGSASAYDPSTDTWDPIADMPEERSTQACGVVGGRIIVAGGTLQHRSSVDPLCSNTTVVYNPADDTWAHAARMGSLRDDCAAACLDGKLYVAGGISGFESQCFNSTEFYDPGRDVWLPGVPMLEVREGCAAGVLGGRMYVCGGARENSYWHGTASAADCLNTVEAFDPRAGTWQRAAPMLHRKFGLSATALGGTLLVFGGARGVDFTRQGEPGTVDELEGGGFLHEECLDVVEVYDPRADAWRAVRSMISRRNFCGVGVVNM